MADDDAEPIPSDDAPDAGAPTLPSGQPSPRHVLYRLWNSVYPDAVCQSVVDEFADADLHPAVIQTADGASSVVPETRKTSTTFIEPGHWAGALVSHFAREANLLWKFDLAGMGELSFLRYEPGDHFTWHSDALNYAPDSYAHLGEGLERKLSVTVNLSSPDDYEGGDLEFLNATGQLLTQPELRERGSIIVFPSTVGHRVTPITSGVRYAMVGWMVGPPLR